MLLPCIGLDRRILPKKDGSGNWAICLLKLDNDDVAEVFVDAKSCATFAVGDPLALDCDLSTYNKKLGIRVKSVDLAG